MYCSNLRGKIKVFRFREGVLLKNIFALTCNKMTMILDGCVILLFVQPDKAFKYQHRPQTKMLIFDASQIQPNEKCRKYEMDIVRMVY